jgi:hypothetical protein
MKFKKALLVLTDIADQAIIEEIVGLCRKFKSKLYVLFVLEPKKVNRISRMIHRVNEVVHKELSEQGWQALYLVEDEAVAHSVWTSLHMEEGSLTSTVAKFVEAYAIDCVYTRRNDETKRLFVTCPAPIIGL